jgi:predicted metal-dependent hydrolase
MFYKKLETPIMILLSILGVICFYKYIYDGTDYVKSNLDNNYYKVRSKEGKEEKANLLAIMYTKLNTIVNSLEKSSYSTNVNVQRLITNWKKGVTIKEIGKMESEAAYVINKQYMSFCLPENTSKTIDNLNLMTYVGIHELAHIMSNETGHGNEFIQNFEFLLNYSKTLNYYDPLLKTNMPVYIQLNKLNTADNYCGVSLVNSIN